MLMPKPLNLLMAACTGWLLSQTLPALEVPLASEQNPGPGGPDRVYLTMPQFNSALPEDVIAEPGKVTLFARYSAATDRHVPLYLVNRSEADMDFHTYAGDPGIVLEYFDESVGIWKSTQSGQISFAMCGDSFHHQILKPGQYSTINGYQPSTNKSKGQVRFHLHSQELISNAGAGFWSATDAEKAGIDSSMISAMPFAKDLLWWNPGRILDGDPTIDQVIAQLDLMQTWQDGPVFRHYAAAFKKQTEQLALDGQPQLFAAVKSVDLLLGRKPSDTGENAFIARCLEILRTSEDKATEARTITAWGGLAWVLKTTNPPPDERWRSIYHLVYSRAPAATPAEHAAMSLMIRGQSMVYEYLNPEFLIESAKNHPPLMAACLERLSSAQNWEGLKQIAEGRDFAIKLQVLPFLILSPPDTAGKRRIRTGADKGLWLECIRESPWITVEAVAKAMITFEGYYMEPTLSLALHDSGKEFAAKATTEPWPDRQGRDFQGLRQYVRNLGLNASPKSPMLHDLRKLAATRPPGETDEQNQRRQQLAREARRQLLVAGWEPDDR